MVGGCKKVIKANPKINQELLFWAFHFPYINLSHRQSPRLHSTVFCVDGDSFHTLSIGINSSSHSFCDPLPSLTSASEASAFRFIPWTCDVFFVIAMVVSALSRRPDGLAVRPVTSTVREWLSWVQLSSRLCLVYFIFGAERIKAVFRVFLLAVLYTKYSFLSEHLP